MAKKKTGTREWAEVNVNIFLGCEHRCRYCYAAEMAKRFKRITSLDDWGTTCCELRPTEVNKARKKVKGRIMFPTSHDITPRFLDECVTVLKKLLAAGNDMLIVSKPHLECVERLCRELAASKEKIVFRFTIGAIDDELLRYWEPGAPAFAERFAALKHAHGQGFRTSVSAEPMLDVPHAVELYKAVAPFVTDTVWFGKMNDVRRRVEVKSAEDEAAVKRIEQNQTDERIVELYGRLKNKPKVAWKDSIRKIVGLAAAGPVKQEIVAGNPALATRLDEAVSKSIVPVAAFRRGHGSSLCLPQVPRYWRPRCWNPRILVGPALNHDYGTENPMPGQFTRIGETAFPGEPNIRSGLYEWCSTTPEKHGQFKIRFVSDETQGRRRFWVEPLLRNWMEGTETRFLEEACAYGAKIVAEMNHHGPEQRWMYQLAALLFRNRHEGHMAVHREFLHAADFVDVTEHSVLLPGLENTGLQGDPSGLSATTVARRVLQAAFQDAREGLAEQGQELPKLKSNRTGVLQFYEQFMLVQRPKVKRQAHCPRSRRRSSSSFANTCPAARRWIFWAWKAPSPGRCSTVPPACSKIESRSRPTRTSIRTSSTRSSRRQLPKPPRPSHLTAG